MGDAVERRSLRLRVSGGFWLVAVGILLNILCGTGDFGNRAASAVAVFLAIVIHEAGHLIAAWACRVRIDALRLDVLGARLHTAGLLSYGQEAMVAAGGPVASGLSAALASPLWASRGYPEGGMLCLLVGASAVLGGLNLLPVGTLDGGRMLYCALAYAVGERLAEAVLRLTGGACALALWLFSVYALLRAGDMIAPFAFSLVLLVRVLQGDYQE